jgi:predicted RNA-binding protein YlqC (UPF0109 family)
MENPNDSDLAARVADIEKTIGDVAKVLKALKEAVNRVPSPDCPPYCSHAIETNYSDEMALPLRVADISKYIGDAGDVFGTLRLALNAIPEPDCPPYCGTEESQR